MRSIGTFFLKTGQGIVAINFFFGLVGSVIAVFHMSGPFLAGASVLLAPITVFVAPIAAIFLLDYYVLAIWFYGGLTLGLLMIFVATFLLSRAE